MAERHIGEVGLGELRQAASAGVPAWEVGGAAFELVFDRPARLSAAKRARLSELAEMCDRFAVFGSGQRGAGANVLLDLIVGQAEELADATTWGSGAHTPVSPRSLAYFLPALRAAARKWRRGFGRTRAERRQRRKRC